MEGTLASVPVTEVLQDLASAGRSGVVHLSQDGATKRIYFKEGALVFASSDVESERLGERLVKLGKLRRSELELACKVLESSPLRLGQTLVEMGHLTSAELDAFVRDQVTSIVYSLVPWVNGSYRTELVADPIDEDLARDDLSVENILMEAVREIDDPEVIRRGVGNLDGALSYAKSPVEFGQDIHLTPEEGFVLSRVDGVSSAGEIAKLSPMGEDKTLQCVYALLVSGLLKIEPPADSETVSEDGSAADSLSPEAVAFRDAMSAKHAASNSANHYELLDVKPGASKEEIKAAYFMLAKKLHPDHRSGLKLKDPEGIFDALYLKVKAAYEVLSSETARRRYDFSLEQLAQRRGEGTRVKTNGTQSAEPSTPGPTYSTAEMARLQYANGERFFNEARFHEAIEALSDAVRLDPSQADYHKLLARSLAKNPKWRHRAEEHFQKALEVDRFDVETYLELGELYAAGGMSTRARKMFEDALGVDPGNVRALGKLEGLKGDGSNTMDKLKGILGRSKGQ